MKNSFRLYILVAFSLFTVSQSCDKDEELDSDCNNIACTEEYRTIVITIKDQNQNPVALDYFEVTNLEDGSELTIPLSSSALATAQESGQYPLVADGSIEANHELQLQFKGFINNQEVISSNYTAGADCCHIRLISGDLQLIL